MPEQLEASQFSDLYQMRWGIESNYRELKNRLEIESFNCIKPIGIRQEFFVSMFLSNLTAILKPAADYLIPKSSENKHVYQSSRSYILNRMKYNIVFLLRTANSTQEKTLINYWKRLSVYDQLSDPRENLEDTEKILEESTIYT
jgi:hypothetical protein